MEGFDRMTNREVEKSFCNEPVKLHHVNTCADLKKKKRYKNRKRTKN